MTQIFSTFAAIASVVLLVVLPAPAIAACYGECMVVIKKPADLMPEPSARALLSIGYRIVAEGDLMVDRFRISPKDNDPASAQTLTNPYETVVQLPGLPLAMQGEKLAVGARYGNFVRLARDGLEFVCVIDTSDICYRVNSGDKK